jgi:hypothetical protein
VGGPFDSAWFDGAHHRSRKPVFVKDYAEAFALLRKPPLRYGIHKFGHPADFAFIIDAGKDAFGLG